MTCRTSSVTRTFQRRRWSSARAETLTRILGIDPGSRITGFGVIDTARSKLAFVEAGCIRPRPAGSLSDRLGQIWSGLREVLERTEPDEVAIEQVFVARSAASALKLGQARGAALVAVHGRPVAEYAPRAIKLALTGNGGAEKEQVGFMVSRLLRLSATPSEDAADALAVAICHAHGSSLQALGAPGGKRRG